MSDALFMLAEFVLILRVRLPSILPWSVISIVASPSAQGMAQRRRDAIGNAAGSETRTLRRVAFMQVLWEREADAIFLRENFREKRLVQPDNR
jgi:hypothetical protein